MSVVASPKSGGARSAARLAAVQALYQIDKSGGPATRVVEEFLEHRLGREIDGDVYARADETLFADVVRGVCERLGEIDPLIIGALSADWPMERVELVIRMVLRAGVYELLARPDVPAAVIISEYVDVTHAFYGGNEPGFVNGVLDRIARAVRSHGGG